MRRALSFVAILASLACVSALPVSAEPNGICTQDTSAPPPGQPFLVACNSLRQILTSNNNVSSYAICTLTTTAATVCNGPGGTAARFLIGFYNNSINAQTATVTCNDNATTNTGPIAASEAAFGASQEVLKPPPGRPLVNGLVCTASTLPVGAGIEVYVR
ncbi:MAG: hypothetical protein NVS3B7_19360 [Candidatus Elarobacter sp.]